MRYGLDSSVAFKWFVRETGSDEALRLRDAFRAGIHDCLHKHGPECTIAYILPSRNSSSVAL